MLSFNDERDNIEYFDSGRLSNNLETVSKYACNKNLIHYKNSYHGHANRNNFVIQSEIRCLFSVVCSNCTHFSGRSIHRKTQSDPEF